MDRAKVEKRVGRIEYRIGLGGTRGYRWEGIRAVENTIRVRRDRTDGGLVGGWVDAASLSTW